MIKDHSPEYIALKFQKLNVDFDSLIKGSSVETSEILLQAAEKHKKMENTPPSKWKKLLIEFSDFCKTRGKNMQVENIRGALMYHQKKTPDVPAKKQGNSQGISM